MRPSVTDLFVSCGFEAPFLAFRNRVLSRSFTSRLVSTFRLQRASFLADGVLAGGNGCKWLGWSGIEGWMGGAGIGCVVWYMEGALSGAVIDVLVAEAAVDR